MEKKKEERQTELSQTGLSRRSFLRGSVLAAGGAALGLAGCAPESGGAAADGGAAAGDAAGAAQGEAEAWDKEVDVLVVGTGTVIHAAIACSELGSKTVLIAEKDPAVFGGTSSTSGGGHALALLSFDADEGIEDTREDVLTYMRLCGDDRMDENVQAAFVDTCDEFAHWVLDTHGWAKWGHINRAFSDYYELYEGSLPGGFGHGSWYPFSAEGEQLGAPKQWPVYQAYVDSHENIELSMGTSIKSLVTDGTGAVVGAVLDDGGGDMRVKAGAVVLGTGGFEHNEEMRRFHLPFPYYRSNGSPNNTGDGQRVGAKIGAQLAHMDEAFGCPHFDTDPEFKPGVFRYDAPGSDAFAPRGFPHSVIVNRKGRRFADEATMYATFNRSFGVYDTGTMEFVNIPGFWIADSVYAETFLLPGYAPAATPPEFVVQADTLEELADKLGIDKEGLLDEIAAFNANAANGTDPVWHRGKPVSVDTLAMMGQFMLMEGATLPETVLGTVEKGPFYACRYVPGMMGGTRGGLKVDANAQVVDVDGSPIPGLYAAGNCSSGVAAYWAGGATLGQGAVLAYLAAKHICGA
ncbi:MAG: FAD-binding protein [Coriobacteriales bacterium]|jgi:succinate dehydrogenase/fumarate reductase flavoprotein subunit|nr:FAD-binding protein [Coriobacteriales bacterium]